MHVSTRSKPISKENAYSEAMVQLQHACTTQYQDELRYNEIHLCLNCMHTFSVSVAANSVLEVFPCIQNFIIIRNKQRVWLPSTLKELRMLHACIPYTKLPEFLPCHHSWFMLLQAGNRQREINASQSGTITVLSPNILFCMFAPEWWTCACPLGLFPTR